MRLLPTPTRTPTTIAHRGASAYAPENTLTAIRQAVHLGATWSRSTCSAPATARSCSATTPSSAAPPTPHECSRGGAVADRRPDARRDAAARRRVVVLPARTPASGSRRWSRPRPAGRQRDRSAAGGRSSPARYPGSPPTSPHPAPRRCSSRRGGYRLVVQSFDHGVMRDFARLEPDVPSSCSATRRSAGCRSSPAGRARSTRATAAPTRRTSTRSTPPGCSAWCGPPTARPTCGGPSTSGSTAYHQPSRRPAPRPRRPSRPRLTRRVPSRSALSSTRLA